MQAQAWAVALCVRCLAEVDVRLGLLDGGGVSPVSRAAVRPAARVGRVRRRVVVAVSAAVAGKGRTRVRRVLEQRAPLVLLVRERELERVHLGRQVDDLLSLPLGRVVRGLGRVRVRVHGGGVVVVHGRLDCALIGWKRITVSPGRVLQTGCEWTDWLRDVRVRVAAVLDELHGLVRMDDLGRMVARVEVVRVAALAPVPPGLGVVLVVGVDGIAPGERALEIPDVRAQRGPVGPVRDAQFVERGGELRLERVPVNEEAHSGGGMVRWG